MDDLLLLDTLVEKGRVEFHFEARGTLKPFFGSDRMYVEYETDVSDVPVSLLNASFVASFLPLVWLTHTTMWVTELDRMFYDCLYRLRIAYGDLYSHYPLGGKLVAAKLINNTYEPERESLLLFGGGIDAHSSYLRIRETDPVLCNIAGWCDSKYQKHIKAAKADFEDIRAFAQNQGRDCALVRSNFAVIVNNEVFDKEIGKKLSDSWWHSFQHSMSFISIAMPLALKYKVKNIYIGSSFALGRPGVCASYATTDIEFKFATVGGCVHDAFELSRQEKVRLLVEYCKASKKPYPVRVCSFNDKNCCKCEKCFRTILEIVAENGNVSDFGFEIDGSLTEHWASVFSENMAQFGVAGEKKKHWPDIIRRMKENYDNISEKEFVDWFLSFDFEAAKKRAVRKYYRRNFFSILKRKIRGR